MSKNGTDIEHHLGWKEFDHHFPVAHRFLVSIYEINRRLWRCCGQHREIPVRTSVSTKYNTEGQQLYNSTTHHDTHIWREKTLLFHLFFYLIIIERKLKNLLLYSLLLLSRRNNMKCFRCLTQQPLPAAQQLDLFFLFLFSFSCVLSYIII